MESVARTPEVPGKKKGEGRITRRFRLKGPPKEGRLLGVRRLPRNLAGGILMMVVLLLFFGGLAGDPLRFLAVTGGLVAVFGFAVWALARAPIRARFDQRWRPKRRIEPLDLSGWRRLAEAFGAELRPDRLPRLQGNLDGVSFELAFHQVGGARTEATARLPEPVASPLRGFPRRAEFHTRIDCETGDPAFDRAYRLEGEDPSVARLFTPDARRHLLAAEPEEIEVAGDRVAVRRSPFVGDATILLAMVRAATALARG